MVLSILIISIRPPSVYSQGKNSKIFLSYCKCLKNVSYDNASLFSIFFTVPKSLNSIFSALLKILLYLGPHSGLILVIVWKAHNSSRDSFLMAIQLTELDLLTELCICHINTA